MMPRILTACSVVALLSLSACGGTETRTVIVNPSPAPSQTVVVPQYSPSYAPSYTVAPAQVVVAPPPARYATVVVPQQGVTVVCPSYNPNCYTVYTTEDEDTTGHDHR